MGYRLRSIIDLHGYAVTKIKRLSPLIPHPAGGFERTGRTHSVHPTSGIRRVFWQFSTPQPDSVFERCPHPAHLRLTQAVETVEKR